jgi:pimeloyl-ACP methyl ester carboxylesterase
MWKVLTDMKKESFQIQISDETLSDLKNRLLLTRWPPENPLDWDYGTSASYLQELTHYWIHQFDWRKQEKFINQFEQFRATISGVELHFIHLKGKGPNSIPLLLTHGWPSTFVGMLRILPLLIDSTGNGSNEAVNFDVVVPSIPGFGFSEKPSNLGMNIFRIADLWAELMGGLGYPRFASYGEDWGAYMSAALGWRHPTKILGIHLGFIPGSIRPELSASATILTNSESNFLAKQADWEQFEGGYEHLQSTKPQTIAYSLTDSPVGLAAWLVEKFRNWSDCNGDIESTFSMDDVLTHVMVYWATKTAGSSARLYYETRREPWVLEGHQKISVPTSVTVFPKDLSVPPKEWAERIYNIVRWSMASRGGHFPAWEQPQYLASEIRSSFGGLRP